MDRPEDRNPMNENVMASRLFERVGKDLPDFHGKRKYAAREVFISVQNGADVMEKNRRFDLVLYETSSKIFRVIELKADHTQATVKESFKQLEKYRETLAENVPGFLDAFTRRSPMRYSRQMEATSNGAEIHAEFYVGLTEEACAANIKLLLALKEKFPGTGIIPVKSDGEPKYYLKLPDGKRDYEIAKASPVTLAINPQSDSTESKFRIVSQEPKADNLRIGR